MNEPKNYEYLLLCDGSTISEENYPELVGVLGGTQLPNLIDRFLQGSATAGTYKEAGLPNITGWIGYEYNNSSLLGGAFYCKGHNVETIPGGVTGAANSTDDKVYFNASKSNSIYGASTTVQPPSYTAKIYICYAG